MLGNEGNMNEFQIIILSSLIIGVWGVGCPKPDLPHAEIFSEHESVNDLYSMGTRMKIHCKDEISVNAKQHNVFIRCVSSGQWQGLVNETFCYGICKDPGNIEDTTRSVAKLSPNNPVFLYGDNVTYTCNKGYFKDLNSAIYTRTCKQDFSWTSAKYECYVPKVSCPLPENIPHGFTKEYRKKIKGMKNYLPTDVIQLNCEDDYSFATNPSVRLLCLQSGQWHKPIPTCKKHTCQPPEDNDDIVFYPLNKTTFSSGEKLKISCKKENQFLVNKYSKNFIDDTIVCNNRKNQLVVTAACIDITCLNINVPDYGRMTNKNRTYTVGHTVEFSCNEGYTLIGSSNRTCLRSGHWSGTLTTCENYYSYCLIPGVPPGAIKHGSSYHKNAIVSYRCSSQLLQLRLVGESQIKCLTIRKWNSTIPSCISKYMYASPDAVANQLRNSLDFYKRREVNILSGRTIRVKKKGHGLDIYFILDVSESVGVEGINNSVNLVVEVVKQLGVNPLHEKNGNRVGVVTFSAEASYIINLADVNYKNSMDVIKKLRSLNSTKHGTNIAGGLKKVEEQINLYNKNFKRDDKKVYPSRKNNTKIIILFTDGKYNTKGNALKEAKDLKSLAATIYVIGINIDTTSKSNELLRKIATKKEYFYNLKNNGLVDVMKKLLSKKHYGLECGITGVVKMHQRMHKNIAARGAWPWTVRLEKSIGFNAADTEFACGGTIIDKNWILTAAHCFDDVKDVKRWKVKMSSVLIERKIEKFIFHPEYKPAPDFTYDVALVNVKFGIQYDFDIRRVCVPTIDTVTEMKKPGKYGVVTGWGHWNSTYKEELTDMKEIYIKINEDKKCESIGITYKGFPKFCAGENKYDSGKGDSGGPFVHEITNKENRKEQFYIIGIVSHESSAASNFKTGYYTFLSPEIITWIQKSIGKNVTEFN